MLLAFAVSVVSFSALGVLLGSILPNARAGQGGVAGASSNGGRRPEEHILK